ncbi:MAG: hypothetical protein K8S94_16000 [Planctomycetia bacterium]|nr:hypothetical protein [Planctomycetia bacterium]
MQEGDGAEPRARGCGGGGVNRHICRSAQQPLEWLGHTPKVALEFYAQVLADSCDLAAAEIVTLDPSVTKSA